MKRLKLVVLVIMLLLLCQDVYAGEISDTLFRKVIPEGNSITIKGKAAVEYGEAYHYINNYLENHFDEEGYQIYGDCNPNDLTSCYIEIYTNDYQTSWNFLTQSMTVVSGWKERYDVSLVYDEPVVSSECESKIAEIKSQINIDYSDVTTFFKVEDLSLINYYLTGDKSELWNPGAASRAIKFSNINKITKGANITYDLVVGLGEQGEELMYEDAGGEMVIYLNGYAYGMAPGAVYLRRIIYIPSDTPDTTEAYISAASKRINEYLKNEEVLVSLGGTLSSLNPDYLDPTIDILETDGNYYNIKILNKTYKFYIIKTNETLTQPIYEGTDLNSKIEITSQDSNVPLDTALTVKIVNDTSIKEKIGTDNYKSYDISLFSTAKNAKIEKLNNGKFLVKIPVPEELKGKNLIIYYIPTDGNLEKHEVSLEENDNYAVFETDHFSIYTLAEVSDTLNDTNNPQTSDNIMVYILICFISIICIFKSTYIFNKK